MPEGQSRDEVINLIVNLGAAADVASNPANDPEIQALGAHVAGLLADEVKAKEAGS